MPRTRLALPFQTMAPVVLFFFLAVGTTLAPAASIELLLNPDELSSKALSKPKPIKRGHRDKDKPEGKVPKFDYYLDESDPDILSLRREDGSFVAAFSARGATKEGIIKAAKEDYRALVWPHEGKQGQTSEGDETS